MPGKRQNFLATWISLSLIYKNPVQKKNATSQQRVHEKKKKDAQSCALELKPPPFNLKNNIIFTTVRHNMAVLSHCETVYIA